MDAQKNIYVTDQNNSRIQKWVPGAISGVTIAGYLSSPTAVYFDAPGNMYVSEQNGSDVKKFAPGSITGVIVAGGNGYGSASNQLSSPTGIYVDAAGNIFICDTDNNRVQKWVAGATSGITVAGGNGFGSGANQLANPLAIFLDCMGDIYIADFNNQRVQKWTQGATTGIRIVGGFGTGVNLNQFNGPIGISPDAVNNLVVADFYNNRVLKFQRNIVNAYMARAAGDYTATVNFGCCSVTSGVFKIIAPKTPQISITSNGTLSCPGVPLIFTASTINGGQAPFFQWKKNGLKVGTNSKTYIDNNLSNNDTISCALTSNEGCVISPTVSSNNIVVMAVKNLPGNLNLGPDQILCLGSGAVLNAHSNYSSYKWQDGTADSLFNVSKPGTYSVQVQDSCGNLFFDTVAVSYKNCLAKGFYIPNAFSPNKDGLNEIFGPIIQGGNIKQYQFFIYNSFGQLIYKSTEAAKGWNGTLKGVQQSSGVFIWLCIYQLEGEPVHQEKGTVLIIR